MNVKVRLKWVGKSGKIFKELVYVAGVFAYCRSVSNRKDFSGQKIFLNFLGSCLCDVHKIFGFLDSRNKIFTQKKSVAAA